MTRITSAPALHAFPRFASSTEPAGEATPKSYPTAEQLIARNSGLTPDEIQKLTPDEYTLHATNLPAGSVAQLSPKEQGIIEGWQANRMDQEFKDLGGKEPGMFQMATGFAKQAALIGLYFILPIAPVRKWIEGKLIFQSHLAPHPKSATDLTKMLLFQQAPWKDRFEEVRFKTKDNHELYGWMVNAKEGKPTLLYSDGNAGSLWSILKAMPLLAEGYGLMRYNYRGYGESKGTPSEEGFTQDLEAASDFLANEKNIPMAQQIAHGWSMGGGVTTAVAEKRPFKAVILESTFTKMQDVFEDILSNFPIPKWVRPINFKVQQAFDSIGRVANIKSPLLVLHGDQDEVVPFKLGKKLFETATAPNKQFREVPRQGHSLDDWSTGLAIDEFLTQLDKTA